MATKVGRVALVAALTLGGGYALVTQLGGAGTAPPPPPPTVVGSGQILIEMRAAVNAGYADVTWSVGAYTDKVAISPNRPFARQAAANVGDLVVVVIKAPSIGAQVQARISYVNRPGQPKVCPGAGAVECGIIVKP